MTREPDPCQQRGFFIALIHPLSHTGIPHFYPRIYRHEKSEMINIFKIALTGIRKVIESAQGLAIEVDSLTAARRSK